MLTLLRSQTHRERRCFHKMINETERRESLLALEVARESKSTVGLSQCQLLGAVHCRRYLCFPESQQTSLYPLASRRFPPLFSSGFFSCSTSRWRNSTKTSRKIICSTINSFKKQMHEPILV